VTAHHLIDAATLKECPYCSNNLKEVDWNSEFELEIHYKTADCPCGKKISLKVDFHSCGQDLWKLH